MNPPPFAFSVIPQGTAWPSGDNTPAALIAMTAQEIEALTGVPLAHGSEAGLGPWVATAIRFQSGLHVELVSYEHSPRPGFVVRVDSGFDPAVALGIVLEFLGITVQDVLWVSPRVTEQDS